MTAYTSPAQVTATDDNRARKRTLIGAILILTLIIACVVTVRLYKVAVPEHVDRDTINITANDYEQALNKWRSSNVVEYEISSIMADEEVTLRVNQPENLIYVLRHYRANEPFGAFDPNIPIMPSQYVKYNIYTVNGMFELAKQRLDFMQSLNGERIEPSEEEFDFFHDYIIQFDPTDGHPTYVADKIRTAHRLRELTWRAAGVPAIEVKGFKILK
ncbi:MAG TPA: hypothetical protein VEX13_06065 [Chloroflexia bacterium]|nr:hypothetical protein [Chloroflexia bacterium]